MRGVRRQPQVRAWRLPPPRAAVQPWELPHLQTRDQAGARTRKRPSAFLLTGSALIRLLQNDHLPRQARDKHDETLRNARFESRCSSLRRSAGASRGNVPTRQPLWSDPAPRPPRRLHLTTKHKQSRADIAPGYALRRQGARQRRRRSSSGSAQPPPRRGGLYSDDCRDDIERTQNEENTECNTVQFASKYSA